MQQRTKASLLFRFSFDSARAHSFELTSFAVGSLAGFPFDYCGLVLELDVRFWEGFLNPKDSLFGKLFTFSSPMLPVKATARSMLPNIHSQGYANSAQKHKL